MRNSSLLKTRAKRSLVSLVIAVGFLSFNIDKGVADSISKIDKEILKVVEYVKTNPGFKSGSLYEKYVFFEDNSHMRVIYTDNSVYGKNPNDNIGIEDTITLSKDSSSFYMIRLDLSNLENGRERDFMKLIDTFNKAIRFRE